MDDRVKNEDKKVTFEELLSADRSRKYISYFNFGWLRTELKGDRSSLEQIKRDLMKVHKIRDEVIASLSSNLTDRAAVAQYWSAFVKLRIEALDFWSTLIGATVPYIVGPAEFIRTQRMTTLASCPTIVASVLLATASSLSVGV
jgi:hypothetical protein